MISINAFRDIRPSLAPVLVSGKGVSCDRLERSPEIIRRTGVLFIAVSLFLGWGASVRSETVRYAAVGDSYTFCEGVAAQDCWPALLTRSLVAAGVDIKLAANTSRTGWKVEDVVREELSIFIEARPTFATLLIGVNDWVRGSGRRKFTFYLKTLMDRMQEELPGPERLLIVTIPDFSCAPRGETYGYGRNIARGISIYNAILRREAQARGFSLVDIFPLSQTFCNRPEMFVEDGIHPSAGQYALWERLIFPEAYKILRRRASLLKGIPDASGLGIPRSRQSRTGRLISAIKKGS